MCGGCVLWDQSHTSKWVDAVLCGSSVAMMRWTLERMDGPEWMSLLLLRLRGTFSP